MKQNNTYVFETYRLDTATQLLWNKDTNVALTTKVYRLLLYFLLHKGGLISHEQLFAAVWGNRIVED